MKYLQEFDVNKIELRRSPLGGWICAFLDDDDPTETEGSWGKDQHTEASLLREFQAPSQTM
jgi:hypothetical protein